MPILTFKKTQADALTATLIAASLPAVGVVLSYIASRKYSAHKSQHKAGGMNLTVEYSTAPTPEQIAAAGAILTAFDWSA